MKRQTKTKEKIKEVFIDLMNEKGFNSLSVSDITRNADINRGTFYLHYLDKYDLLDQLESELIDGTANILREETSNYNLKDTTPFEYEVLLKMLNYTQSEFSFIEAIASEKGDPQFTSKYKRVLELHLEIKFGDYKKKLRPIVEGLSIEYNREIMLAAASSIILLWIRTGGKDSPEKIAELIMEATKISPYDLIA